MIFFLILLPEKDKITRFMAISLSRLERGTHNAEVGGSSPPIATIIALTICH